MVRSAFRSAGRRAPRLEPRAGWGSGRERPTARARARQLVFPQWLALLCLVSCAGGPGTGVTDEDVTEATNPSLAPPSVPGSTATGVPTNDTSPPGSASPPEPSESPPADAPPSPSGQTDSSEPIAPARRCVAPEGVSASPRSIPEVVDLINALPQPVSVECLLESLERPLDAYATNSFVSAQPAEGNKNPRLFLLMGDSLTISVVPTGPGSEVVEFGEYTSDVRSLKGELPFPINERIEPSAPFTHIRDERGGTVCRLCHAEEARYSDLHFEDAFDSVAIRPNPIYNVPLAYVFAEYQACDADLEAERCAILSGLFAHGEVRFRDFPEHLPVFF